MGRTPAPGRERYELTDHGRRQVCNVTLPEPLVTEAKALNVNISRAAEAGVAAAVKAAREAAWLAENRAAIEATNAWVAEHGLPLAKQRLF